MKNGWIAPETIALVALLGAGGCWNREDDAELEPPEEERRMPADQARQELAQLSAHLRVLPAGRKADVQRAAALLVEKDADTNASVALAAKLTQALRDDPALQVGPALAAADPALAQRVAALRAALDVHTELLNQLSLPTEGASGLNLPPAPDPEAPPEPATVEAALLLEGITDARWPINRVFVAYGLELATVQADAEKLVAECDASCAEATVTQAGALAAAAARLSALIEEFASIYC